LLLPHLWQFPCWRRRLLKRAVGAVLLESVSLLE
jgi:hypothetical protein